jgi:hypothetical protein
VEEVGRAFEEVGTMSEKPVSASVAMDEVIVQHMVIDYVASRTLAQASVKVNGQWFEVQVMPRTREEIIASFGQAD